RITPQTGGSFSFGVSHKNPLLQYDYNPKNLQSQELSKKIICYTMIVDPVGGEQFF
ncbi:unnamed protein product, partial [marine sediment metagenome]